MTATWPDQLAYQDVFQFPRLSLVDPELAACTVAVRTPFGLPLPITGASTNVYRMRHPDGREWAVRVFLRPSRARPVRFQALAAHLANLPAPLEFWAPFEWQGEGIRVGDGVYPLVKMPWVDGETLNRHVERRINDSDHLERLAVDWQALTGRLEAARIAHGDLQHGNILVEAGAQTFQLIDFDAVWVPALAAYPVRAISSEVGHPAYQHPMRVPSCLGPTIDRFAARTIYIALRALARAPELWYRLDNGDNLLFRREDFQAPERSRTFLLLRQLLRGHDDVLALVDGLQDACRKDVMLVPSLVVG